MTRAVDTLADYLIAHAIELERLKLGTARRLLKILTAADAALVSQLRDRLDSFGATGAADAARKAKSLKRLVDAIVDGRASTWTELRQAAAGEFKAIGRFEAGFHADALEKAIAIKEVEIKAIGAAETNEAVSKTLVRGLPVRQHWKIIERNEASALRVQLQLGIMEGHEAEAIVRTIRGTQRLGFADGALRRVRQQVTSVTGTAITSIAENVRNAQWQSTDVVLGERWRSVLDGNTTPICQSRDGFGTPYAGFEERWPDDVPLLDPPDARPPAHWGCRSHMEAVINEQALGKFERVEVISTDSAQKRRENFREQARDAAGSEAWSGMTKAERREAVRDTANAWADKNIGRVPASTTYSEFLGRQSVQFQDEVLGRSRAKLFRDGELTLQTFVDASGKTRTLDDLRALYPQAFTKAGL